LHKKNCYEEETIISITKTSEQGINRVGFCCILCNKEL